MGRRVMFLDASIVVAIVTGESDRAELLQKLSAVEGRLFYSPMVRFEATIAIARTNLGTVEPERQIENAEALFQLFMDSLPAEEIPITPEIGRAAVLAAQTYGKVVGHKASLNFGDCFSYAAAKSLGVGLLYKGNDFVFTDLG